MLKLSLFSVVLCIAAMHSNASKVNIDFTIKTVANVLISFETGSAPALDAVERQSFSSRTAKIQGLKASLENHTEKSQKNVQAFLKSKEIPFRSFWISNQISIKDVDAALAESLETLFPEINEIREERIPIFNPVLGNRLENSSKLFEKADELTYGLKLIEVEKAWNITNGTGVLIGHIDSGVRYTHEALRDNYQNDSHSWYDDEDHKQYPYDIRGHGTHTMGTIVGTKGIGVAPGVKWMTCYPSLLESSYLFCSQWMLAPTEFDGVTNPDPSKSPRIISNSWSFEEGERTFDAVTKAWVAAGILPVFSSGNRGPDCKTTTYPGSFAQTIGVAAIDEEKKLAFFSSVGPTRDGRLKPDISGPGVRVMSASVSGDDKYEYKSGTSMACPHVAGVAALVLSVNPNLTVSEVTDLLLMSVDTEVVSTGAQCGGLNDREFPNHHFGYGLLNAFKAVQAAKKTL